MGGAIALDMARRGMSPFETDGTLRTDARDRRSGLTAARTVMARAVAGLGLGRLWIPGGAATSQTTRPFDGNPAHNSDPSAMPAMPILPRLWARAPAASRQSAWVAAAFQAHGAIDRNRVQASWISEFRT